MPMTDPIADMLSRIRNGAMAKHDSVRIPYSNMKFAIAKIMESEGYIGKVEVDETMPGPGKELIAALKYKDGKPFIREIKRISKPGRRIYSKADELPRVYSDIGVAIISTPNGLMTNKSARKRKLGGEVICQLF